ncbi:hypothetical protein [Streptomyces sp. WG7]|uniref:hypothetical protein n=1 Tax=Streptomyces sp. WG7 TaxID=3417650 RepID=UPI003CEB52AD
MPAPSQPSHDVVERLLLRADLLRQLLEADRERSSATADSAQRATAASALPQP